jgi:hypothetical protein
MTDAPRPARRHLTYANVAATLAVVLALTGTAYAAGLPKDSVGSKQIKNNAVKSKDLKDASVTGKDLRADTVTGGDVDESSLGLVPDAAALGGVPASGYAPKGGMASGDFFEGSPLELSVPGYGVFRLLCDDNNTATTSDDRVQYAWAVTLGTSPVMDGTLANGSAGTVDVVTANVASVAYGSAVPTLGVSVVHRAADGSRGVFVTGRGGDASATTGCRGTLAAQVVK